MLPGELKQMLKLRDFFDLEEIPVSVKPCRSAGFIIEGYSKEEINFFKQQVKYRKNVLKTIDFENNVKWYTSPEQFQTEDINFLGWNCTAGYSAITINTDGTVTRGSVCQQEYLGNIKDGFTIFKKPKPCITDRRCDCNSDLKMPKWRIG
jgi:MoaA/NifB/PqqE/SkfB family radical SAM enzyme